MKQIFVLITSLCFFFETSTKAQDLHSKIKDTTSVTSITNVNGIDGISDIHAIDNRMELMYGIKAGINVSDVFNGLGDTRALSFLGWVGGVFVSIPINKLLGFQPELMLAEKGFKVIGTVDNNNYTFKRKTIYLDLPLLLQFKPTSSISLIAGPLLSLILYTHDKYEVGPITEEQKQAITNGIIHKNVVGAEVGSDIYVRRIVASLRFGWDLQDIYNHAPPSDSRRYQSYWYQVTVGYRF